MPDTEDDIAGIIDYVKRHTGDNSEFSERELFLVNHWLWWRKKFVAAAGKEVAEFKKP